MITTLKVIFFIISIIVTSALIEDTIERIIVNSKKDFLSLYSEYETGKLRTFNVLTWVIAIVSWGVFYILYQI